MADNTEIELELTYLAKEIPGQVKDVEPQKLLDIYIPEDAERPSIRLRQSDSTYVITKKQPISLDDFSQQTEQTIPLKKDEFIALAKTSNRKVEKSRYKITVNGSVAEVDIFTGRLEGLVVIDFEFNSVADKDAFVPPKFCLADVTQELFLAGGQLAGRSYSDIEDDLRRFKYKKLSL